MSRVGKVPVPIPEGVRVTVQGSRVRVEGPLGALERELPSAIRVARSNGAVVVERTDPNDPAQRSLHGLVRSLIRNMVEGVMLGKATPQEGLQQGASQVNSELQG